MKCIAGIIFAKDAASTRYARDRRCVAERLKTAVAQLRQRL